MELIRVSTSNPINIPPTNNKTSKVLELSSRSELLKWATNNQCTSFELLEEKLKKNTFRDENGVLRYNDTWLPAPDDNNNEFCMDDDSRKMKHFFQTGCSEISFPVAPVLSNDSTADHSGHGITVKIMSNWERLWVHHFYDQSDELAEHAALLRKCIEFFMHERSLQLYWAMVLYNGCLAFWLSWTLSSMLDLQCILFLHHVTCGVLYVNLHRLYLNVRSQQLTEENAQSSLRERLRGTSSLINSAKFKYTLHWRGALHRYCSAMFLQMQSLHCCRQDVEPALQTNDMSRNLVSSFDHLMNIALKYIIQHYEVHIGYIGINRPIYRRAFRCISLFLPVYCIGLLFFNIVSVVNFCAISAQDCQSAIIYTVMTFGFLTNIAIVYLLYGSLVVSLIGLIYGTELAYHMVHCWMKRYSTLRKIRPEQNEDDKVTAGDDDSLHRTPSSKKKSTVEESTIMDYSLPLLSTSTEAQLRGLSKQLQTDATEQYLFIVEYMRQAGVLCAPTVVWMYAYALFLIVAILYMYFVNYLNTAISSYIAYLMASFFCQILMFIIFPTWSLAHANSLITPLLELFSMASKEDFAIIGT